MKTNDRQTATGEQPVRRLGQKAIQNAQLVVYCNPQCLKHPCSGMNLSVARRWGHRLPNQISQLGCCPQGPLLTNLAGNPLGKAFFTILTKNLDQILLAAIVQPVGGCIDFGLRVHAHIQRCACSPTKAPLSLIKLR